MDELGLPTEESVWLFAPGGSELSLFVDSIEKKGPRHEELLEEISAGRIAVLHGAGDFSSDRSAIRPTRRMVAEALEYLERRARIPAIWTNHGDEGDRCNMGGNAPTYQEGDRPDSDAYVLDLLLQAGVQYFWTDHNYRNDIVFEGTSGKAPALVVSEKTRSGHVIRCFHRYRGARRHAPDAGTLAWQLRKENLDRLEASRGVTVIYQHWFVHRDRSGQAHTAAPPVFGPEALAALQDLSQRVGDGRLEVLPISTLLARAEGGR